ncbi:very-long-chain (3R)-3-hydroxyacyl-CoA dehydratase 4 isoform X7 [Sapajus apella]|uniref:Very-long-chain (3R)-3-hydroxyacyl-CoA dehydratase n=1 Tax=Sapajus apella TaxID=9515 RepID=A0A6J3JP90_SAPAP|nr:very-long-chain (3R)-3-hydroxyacyl-CoA dehydratase 4 isoform X7 [Sapajus apella]
MGPLALPAWLQPRYRKNAYLFIYYLIQFCGHSWIFTNMTVRFFSFGKDSMVDTFYAIGFVMRLCQSISLLELLHIYVGIEYNHLLPRFLQLTERIIILFVVITSQEEVQGKYVVCVLFIFWNLLDMVRYTYSMLSVIGISYAVLTWLSQTLWMPIYPLCVLAEETKLNREAALHSRQNIVKKQRHLSPSLIHCMSFETSSCREISSGLPLFLHYAFAIYQSLPYFESFGTYSTELPFDLSIYFPYVLKIYLMMLFIGMYFTYSHLYSERRDILGIFPIKKKKM